HQGTKERPAAGAFDCAVPSTKDVCYRDGTIESTRADVAAFWTSIGLLGVLLSERAGSSAPHTAVAASVAPYQRQAFQDGAFAPGEVAHGFVFFASPVERGFRKATLLLRFRAAEAPSDVLVRLPLLGLAGSGQVDTH